MHARLIVTEQLGSGYENFAYFLCSTVVENCYNDDVLQFFMSHVIVLCHRCC